MMSRLLIIIATLCFSCSSASAQFTGGNKDGYDASLWTNPLSIYAGGGEDGYGVDEVASAISIFAGGVKDGYDSHMYKNTSSIYLGGDEDGYGANEVASAFSIFAGGGKDGYHLSSKILSYTWTGALGTNWNVTGNWLDTIVPNINSNVIIPASATNYPVIKIGIMSIGQDPNAGLYLCKRMTVRHGAELTFDQDSFLENYGTLNIRGSLYFENSVLNALTNANGGHLNVFSGGRLIVD